MQAPNCSRRVSSHSPKTCACRIFRGNPSSKNPLRPGRPKNHFRITASVGSSATNSPCASDFSMVSPSGLLRATSERKNSPEETCSKFKERSLAARVPFPAPGGPTKIMFGPGFPVPARAISDVTSGSASQRLYSWRNAHAANPRINNPPRTDQRTATFFSSAVSTAGAMRV